jgi:prophage antirepressor-like protein
MTRKFKLFKLGVHPVRGFIADDGAPWVVARDLATPLELTESAIQKVSSRLPPKHKGALTGEDFIAAEMRLKRQKNRRGGTDKLSLPPPLKKGRKGGGANRLTVVSETGLNRIIARSDAALKEGTFAFRYVEWIMGVVLPALRKDGAYAMTSKDKALARAMPGWSEARAEGKVVSRTLTDAVKQFAAYAKSQGSNRSELYFKHFTSLAYKLALDLDMAPPGGRDTLGVLQLLRVENVEDWLVQFIDEEREAEVQYREAFKNVKARTETIFLRRRAA